MATKTKELMNKVSNEVGYTVLQNFDLQSSMAQEMDGLKANFDHIKMPSGGVTVFTLPTDNPEKPEMVQEFSAVILHHHPMRAYYKTKYTGGNNPPDCGSFDGLIGQGDPGGNCTDCPLNEFGTGENGSKGCKERRRLFLLREGETFPIVLSLPPGSLKDFSRYLIRCLSKGYGSNMVVTKFSLTTATNKGGIVYAKAQFSVNRPLTNEELPLIMSISAQIKELSQNIIFEPHIENDDSKQQVVVDVTKEYLCHDCGLHISSDVAKYTENKYGHPLCDSCKNTLVNVA